MWPTYIVQTRRIGIEARKLDFFTLPLIELHQIKRALKRHILSMRGLASVMTNCIRLLTVWKIRQNYLFISCRIHPDSVVKGKDRQKPRGINAPVRKNKSKFKVNANKIARMQRDDKDKLEQYVHSDKERPYNPPVGLVTPETDRSMPKTKYAYDPHLDPQLV